MDVGISRHTNAMMCLHATLIRAISTLKKKRLDLMASGGHKHHQTMTSISLNDTCENNEAKTYIKIGTGRALRPLISCDDTMLPLWKEFADALCALSNLKDVGVVHLLISHVHLTGKIFITSYYYVISRRRIVDAHFRDWLDVYLYDFLRI